MGDSNECGSVGYERSAILAGFVMAGILAVTISSSDSCLLLATSAFAKNIYQGMCKEKSY